MEDPELIELAAAAHKAYCGAEPLSNPRPAGWVEAEQARDRLRLGDYVGAYVAARFACEADDRRWSAFSALLFALARHAHGALTDDEFHELIDHRATQWSSGARRVQRVKCPKCKGEVPTENIDRGDGKKRGTCPHCGATFSKTSRRAGYGRQPVFEVEGGGLDMPFDGDGPGRDPLHDPMRILSR